MQDCNDCETFTLLLSLDWENVRRNVGEIINWHNHDHAVVTLGIMSPRDWGSYVGCQDLTNARVVLNQQFLHLLLLFEHIMHIYLKNIRVYTRIYTLV